MQYQPFYKAVNAAQFLQGKKDVNCDLELSQSSNYITRVITNARKSEIEIQWHIEIANDAFQKIYKI